LILLDSLTRLARAYNKGSNSGDDVRRYGHQGHGHPQTTLRRGPRVRRSGSLTVLATALIDTGSRMDELIFQESKGTGNMEVVLDRRLSDRRSGAAIDIQQCGTRKEELLLDPRPSPAYLAASQPLHHQARRGDGVARPPACKYPDNAASLEKIGQFQKDG